MAEICISYARRSKPTVQKLYSLLCKNYEVWWDEQIHIGSYRVEIEHQLEQGKCVIPVWCQSSRGSDQVIDEVKFAQRRGKPLIPVRIEDVEPPLGFGSLQTVDLLGWTGDSAHPGIVELLRNIKKLLRPSETLTIRGRSLESPTFFRSVSSFETQLCPLSAIKALKIFGSDPILVSAYDVIKDPDAEQIRKELEDYRAGGGTVLLDSGNYEAYRKQDKNWDAEQLGEALAKTPHDLAFSFDELEPPSDGDGVVRGVLEAVKRDSRIRPVLPIVHVPRPGSGTVDVKLVAEVMKRVALELRPLLIAIPERELGSGLLERARVVRIIRKALNEVGFYQAIHLLGTGNPLSIAVLAAAGADCFDGLEWCRTVADHQTGQLYHFHQFDFFSWQSKEAVSPIVREAVSSDHVEFSAKVIFHNLEFFNTWMSELQSHVRNKKIDRFLVEKLPPQSGARRLLEKALPEVFG